VIGFVVDGFGLSMRRACRLMGLSRTGFGYKAKERQDEQVIRKRIRELAQRWRRFGSARLHVMLRREGFLINHKRTERIYREEGLLLRIRRRRKMASVLRTQLPKPERWNQIWSMDFMEDNLSNGRKIKTLTIVDEYSRKCHAIEVDTSIGGARVCNVLSQIVQKEGLAEAITIDNGPEFIGKALDAWAYQRGINLHFITPGKPQENPYIESFNGKFRDECLNQHWFLSLEHARRIVEEWRVEYNRERPHSSLGYLTPEEFLHKETEKVSTGMPVEVMTDGVVYSNSEWHNKWG
jgi:putative transposase